MEENNEGKKTIKIENNTETVAKKPIKVTSNEEIMKEENVKSASSGFEKKSAKSKILWLLIPLIAIVIIYIIINNVPPDIETIKDSIVMIKTYDYDGNELATGSGFCAFKNNYIVTNYHVIDGAYEIDIITDENRTYKINKILIFNEYDDLAIISGNFELTPLKIGSVSNLKAGEKITAIGSPKGQLNTVSTGVISNADNDYDIRITAPISPGSSGGALLNKNGKVIGITFATYNSYDSQNINYAISINYLNKMYSALETDDIITINNNNYTRFMGDLNNFDDYEFNNTKYYNISSLDILYKMTDIFNRFEYLLEKENYSWYEIYTNLSSSDKVEVIKLFNELNTVDFNDDNVADNIKNWDVTDFFISLNVLNTYEYAITAIDISNYTNKDKTFNHVNEEYPLDAAEKSLILYLMGNHYWSDIHTDNKQDIFNYFDERYGTRDLGAILEMLGYEVVYENDGTLTGYW